MKDLLLKPQALDDLSYWSQEKPRLLRRIFELFRNIAATPFTGIGKPEALKGNLQGLWSRRIDEEHRLIYKVTEDTIIIASCRTHYDNL